MSQSQGSAPIPMIERVARAIYEVGWTTKDAWVEATSNQKEAGYIRARAAIEAMRDPPPNGLWKVVGLRPVEAWHHLIDQILNGNGV